MKGVQQCGEASIVIDIILIDIIITYHYHLYADDLQLYTSFPQSTDHAIIQYNIKNCITDIQNWFTSNSLSLNVSKTDTILFSKIPSIVKITDSFLATLPLSNKITTLGITIDSTMKYDSHILNVIRTANFYLYNIHKADAKLSFDITKSLIYSLVFSRFDCNSLFVFVPDNIMIKFEKIQRRAVRVLKLRIIEILIRVVTIYQYSVMGTITNFHDRRSSINFFDHFLTIVDLCTQSFFNDRRSSIV